MCSVSNGYIGWVLDSCDLFLAGVYASKRHMVLWEGSHRARLPAPSLLELSGSQLINVSLDMRRAVVSTAHSLSAPNEPTLTVTRKYYAHRTRRFPHCTRPCSQTSNSDRTRRSLLIQNISVSRECQGPCPARSVLIRIRSIRSAQSMLVSIPLTILISASQNQGPVASMKVDTAEESLMQAKC